jgi:hypothetical protein
MTDNTESLFEIFEEELFEKTKPKAVELVLKIKKESFDAGAEDERQKCEKEIKDITEMYGEACLDLDKQKKEIVKLQNIIKAEINLKKEIFSEKPEEDLK